ncbi:sensor histidine kinase [Actinomadura decatromicini]|uniref:Sensor-like histidine kinase SenX3 n=1 Tax=Actinomadura decatromicini TaxID=2604572 RepID=A0A5D3FLQ4_9ACTN|nr:HAMP domain-containing sensor histidine kinase [Actinomadura decatromicini]TYK49119.1 HAMP domain-containing histidine kinase [Actinomadura decatromicini]
MNGHRGRRGPHVPDRRVPARHVPDRRVPDPDRPLLDRARRRVAAGAAGSAALLLAALGPAVYAAAAPGLDAAARRRLRRALAAAEIAGLPAALLLGRAVADRTLAPLDEALARRRRFAADVGHELRAPLTRLHTRAQLAARRLRADADAGVTADLAADLDGLVAGTRQLGEVVEDLLTSARIGRRPAALGPVDLGALAAELAAAESPRARERGVTIEVGRPDGAVVRGALVQGSAPALRRVLSALVDNALGHTSPGGHIRLTLSGTPGTVELTVRDDGAGFDPRDTARLLAGAPPVRPGTRAAEGRGLGLGLALAREVVDGHGGTLTAHGRPGAGAAFTVRLPAAAQP